MKKFALILICLLIACTYSIASEGAMNILSDSPLVKYSVYSQNAFGSVTTIKLTSEEAIDKSRFDAVGKEMMTKLKEIDDKLNGSTEHSDIYNFNNASKGQTIAISDITAEVVLKAKELFRETKGAYDPTLYWSSDLMQFTPRWNTIDLETQPYDMISPSDPRFKMWQDSFKGAFKFDDVVLTGDKGSYRLIKNSEKVVVNFENKAYDYEMRLDLGGIGKGYAADELTKVSKANGMNYGFVNSGGSSISLMQPGSNEETIDGKWSVGMRHSRKGMAFDPVLSLSYLAKDGGLSSSGDYENAYEWNGKRYCHIMDPNTGISVDTNIYSATVFNTDAASADALTTAMMVMGKDKAIEFMNGEYVKSKGISIILDYYDDTAKQAEIISNDLNNIIRRSDDYKIANRIDVNGNVVYDKNVVQPPVINKEEPSNSINSKLYWVLGVSGVCLFAMLVVGGGKALFMPTNKAIAVRKGKLFAKGDLIVYVLVLVLIVILFITFVFTSEKADLDKIEIYYDNTLIFRYHISTGRGDIFGSEWGELISVTDNNLDGTYVITVKNEDGHYNVITITKSTDGVVSARMTEADCSRTKECINNFPAIKKDQDIIICVVHKIRVMGVGDGAEAKNSFSLFKSDGGAI